MKLKATKRDVKARYNYIAKIGYCNAQHLLNYEEPFAYSERTEGWACDYYDIDGVLISTGYAPIESKNTKCDYDTVRKYDEMAEKIAYNYDLKYEEQKVQVEDLLQQFISEIKVTPAER